MRYQYYNFVFKVINMYVSDQSNERCISYLPFIVLYYIETLEIHIHGRAFKGNRGVATLVCNQLRTNRITLK